MGKGKVCDSYCRKCIYFMGWGGEYKFCNYYLITDKRRPCDPGTGCTVRALRETPRKERRSEYVK